MVFIEIPIRTRFLLDVIKDVINKITRSILVVAALLLPSTTFAQESNKKTAPTDRIVSEKSEIHFFEPAGPYVEFDSFPKVIRNKKREISAVKLKSGKTIPIGQFRMKTIAAPRIRYPNPEEAELGDTGYSSPGFSFDASIRGRHELLTNLEFGLQITSFNAPIQRYEDPRSIKLDKLVIGGVIPCVNEGLYCFNRIGDSSCSCYLEYVDPSSLSKSLDANSPACWSIPCGGKLGFRSTTAHVRDSVRLSHDGGLYRLVSISVKKIRLPRAISQFKMADYQTADKDKMSRGHVASLLIKETRLKDKELAKLFPGLKEEALKKGLKLLTHGDFKTETREVSVQKGDSITLDGSKYQVRQIVAPQKFDKQIEYKLDGKVESTKMSTPGWVEIFAAPQGEG